MPRDPSPTRTHHTVKLDEKSAQELRRLATLIPIVSVHAVHVAVVRAGIEQLRDNPDKLMSYLAPYKVRISTPREV